MNPVNLIVLQPTPFCNIDCGYCYLPSRNDTNRMSDEVLASAFKTIFRSNRIKESVRVVWHAGEPLTLPTAYYENAFQIIAAAKPDDVAVHLGFQTNGTLITDEWCDLFIRNSVDIGLSVDGFAQLHDANRKTRSGKNTHASTMEGIRRLQDRGVSFYVITVLTRKALDHADELFEFYTASGIDNIFFNMEEVEGVNEQSTLSETGIEEKFKRFFLRMFELQQRLNPSMRILDLEKSFNCVLFQKDKTPPNIQTDPFGIVGVDWQGRFSTFSPEFLGMEDARFGDFMLGNFATDDFDSVMKTSKFREIHSEIQAGVENCRRTCDYFSVCGGGAPSNKYYETGSFASTETLYCRLKRKVLTDIALEIIEAKMYNPPDPRTSKIGKALDYN